MSATPSVSIRLDRGSGLPLAVQIVGDIRDLIRREALSGGSRVPSTRRLAAELGVARGVVEQAYDQLVAEGWLEARRGSGTFVAPGVASPVGKAAIASVRRSRPSPPRVRRRDEIVLGTGTPWVDQTNQATWRRAWRAVGSGTPPADYPDSRGLPELRTAVANHVGRHRGIAVAADNVLITGGTTDGLALLLDILPAGPVALEDPGYRAAAATVLHSGRRLVDVPVDDEGVRVDVLARGPAPRAIYVTPAHQHPLGMSMSAGRRMALLLHARSRNIVIVEDDYDSEFRYDVAPLPALAQLDVDRVVYLGTTSKTLTPALRLGWLITTPDRVELIAERRAARHDHPSWPVQRAMVELFAEGYVDRQIRSARRLYAHRSRIVHDRLMPYGSMVTVAGMYVTLVTAPDVAVAVTAQAARRGVIVQGLTTFCRSADRAGLVIGFGGVGERDFVRGLDVVEAALRSCTGPNAPMA